MARDNDSKDGSHLDDIPHEREGTRPDFSKPLPRKPLPKALQSTLDREDSDYWASIYDGTAPESTESSVRYAAYASRLRTIMLSAHRYVAYTSDIGESFRPIAHPYWVRGAYGISWAYLIGDVSHEGYKAYIRNQRVLNPAHYAEEDAKKEGGGIVQTLKSAAEATVDGPSPETLQPGKVVPIEDYRAVMVQRAVFQSIASMGLPAFTIHSIVRYSGRALKNAKNPALRTWGPIGVSHRDRCCTGCF